MSATGVNIGTEPPGKLMALSAVQLQPILVFGAGCLAIILFALVPATTRIAAAQLSGLSIGLARAVGAGFFSLPLLLVLRVPSPQTLNQWACCFLYSFGNFAGFPLLFGIGVQHTSGSHAALIMAAMPLFIGLIGMLLERRLPRWIWFVGVAIAVAGETALVGMGNMSSGSASVAGDAIVFTACTLSALGIVAGARLGSRISPLAATLWAITIASAGLAPWAAICLLAAPHAYQDLTGAAWVAVLQITLGAAVMANTAWLWVVSRGGLVRVAPIQFAQPVCALFFACALLNEHLSTSLLLVATSIVLGTITACRGAQSDLAPRKKIDFASLRFRRQSTAPLMPGLRPLQAVRHEGSVPMRPATRKSPELEPALS